MLTKCTPEKGSISILLIFLTIFKCVSRAPELLRLKEAHKLLEPASPSSVSIFQKADVYSFAIILYEIHFLGPGLLSPPPETRPGNGFNTGGCKTFGEPNMTPREVLERVFVGPSGSGGFAFRPQTAILRHSCPPFIKLCLTECWVEAPADRADFKCVRNRLRPLRKGMKANIFDNMLSMMEKYATRLETLVDERTQLLVEEKKKTDALLLEMLPRPVAEALKQVC